MHHPCLARRADHLSVFGNHLERVDAVQEGARRIGAIGILVRQRSAIPAGVPFLARNNTGVAPDTGVEIDHEA